MSENKEKDTNPEEEIVNKAKEVATDAVEAVKDAVETVVEKVEEVTSNDDSAEETNEPQADNSINASVAADSKDFDWDSIGKYDELYSKSEREKMEEMYGDTLTSINEQEVLDGIIVSKNLREAVVNIGYKSDGVIPMNELRYKEEVNIGDSVEVFIESQEDKNG
ncbi:S1 RNA-binding domain-containing protein, partial [Vicingaceae bacterium]|nr:S1 RNA-binding domain-containing protein [Vicingaceae bacterium]